jgi:tetratricopeptide (TPR) repeat protein
MDKREVIKHLHQFGVDFHTGQQYPKAENYFKQAKDLAESINDQSLIISEGYCLAVVQGMQGKYQPALNEYAELIQIACSSSNQALSETDHLFLVESFDRYVEAAMKLPDITIANLERVLDRGLNWLLSIGKREWAAGIYLQRGRLRQFQGQHEDALEEFETALAMARRRSDKKLACLLEQCLYVLSGHLEFYLKKPEEAEQYYWELVDENKFDNLYQQRGWAGLAYIALAKKDFPKAESAAQRALDLAQDIESPVPLCRVYDLLGEIYWAQNQIQRVIEAKIQAWRYARQWGDQAQLYRNYSNFFEIRWHQARQNPQRYIPKAQQWLHWALPSAERLDRREANTKRQQFIRQKQAESEQILASLSGEQSAERTESYIAHVARTYYETYLLYAEINLESAYLSNPQEHISTVLQYCRLAWPLAQQLDTQERSTIRQQKLQQIKEECERFSQ